MQDSFKNKIILKMDYQKVFKKLTLQDFYHKFSLINSNSHLLTANIHQVWWNFLSVLPNCCTQIYKQAIPKKVQRGGL